MRRSIISAVLGIAALSFTASLTQAAVSFPATGPWTVGTTVAAFSTYPITFNVSGFSGNTLDVDISLNGITHTFPDDIDALLVSPTGQKSMFMSDAGLTADLVNINYAFSDEASASLQDSPSTASPSGTYLPVDFSAGDTMNAPAPVGPYTAPLSNFDGFNPNGVWSLYIMDDASLDAGSIASATLTIDAPIPEPTTLSALAALGTLALRRRR
ncbi:MAG TPA: proprotein convertase P-domain-containing protein [Tepidisphaeraceae bacterium]|nr:proprotein convertase P-domain-containing protein [Tepidisphaeraceae bacterium]